MKAGRAELRLYPGKERSVRRRHPWIFANSVAGVAGAPAAGATVAVRAADGQWLAWAAYAPDSTIRARCWSFQESATIDAAWLAARVQAAVARRAELAPHSDALRLIYGEADQLPGLIVDRYDRQLVVQFQAAGVEAQRTVLVDALVQATGCDDIYERSDPGNRARAGLAPASGVLRGAAPAPRLAIREHGIAFQVDVLRGHKTGFYIDQRDNRLLLRRLVSDLARSATVPVRVLNCFCYTGGFSLAAAFGGASEVVSIDSSADALALARDNWSLNGLDRTHPPTAQWCEADVFDELRRLHERGARFDVIVLDPPKFAASHHHVERAARAYKDINLSALRLLEPGGTLLTFSCSAAIEADLFQKIVAGAVIDAGVDCQLQARLAAAADHPLLMTHPEGEYLKGLQLTRLRA
jgi:23S rRNA (cytosine1962-C5)-methyltransferase